MVVQNHLSGKWHDYIGSYEEQTNVCIKRKTKRDKEKLEMAEMKNEIAKKDKEVQLFNLKVLAYKSLLSNDDDDESSHRKYIKIFICFK